MTTGTVWLAVSVSVSAKVDCRRAGRIVQGVARHLCRGRVSERDRLKVAAMAAFIYIWREKMFTCLGYFPVETVKRITTRYIVKESLDSVAKMCF